MYVFCDSFIRLSHSISRVVRHLVVSMSWLLYGCYETLCTLSQGVSVECHKLAYFSKSSLSSQYGDSSEEKYYLRKLPTAL